MNYSEDSETAADVVNKLLPGACDIFKKYGEEKLGIGLLKIYAKLEAKKKSNDKAAENIVFHSYPKKWRHGRTHPNTCFSSIKNFC